MAEGLYHERIEKIADFIKSYPLDEVEQAIISVVRQLPPDHTRWVTQQNVWDAGELYAFISNITDKKPRQEQITLDMRQWERVLVYARRLVKDLGERCP